MTKWITVRSTSLRGFRIQGIKVKWIFVRSIRLRRIRAYNRKYKGIRYECRRNQGKRARMRYRLNCKKDQRKKDQGNRGSR